MTTVIDNSEVSTMKKAATHELFVLTKDEVHEIKTLINELKQVADDFEDIEFLKKARVFAYRLPQRLTEFISGFRYSNGNPGAALIRGMEFSDVRRTPTSMEESQFTERNTDSDMLLILMSSILGDLFGWSSQRDGDVINDIFPLPKNENEQLSTGSVVDLAYHTEEAFHPFRADYIGLTCIRNTEGVPTQLSSVKDVELSPEVKQVLLEDRFIFEKDKNFENDEGINEPQAVLFGSENDPYLRIDPAFMRVSPGDSLAEEALREIAIQLQKNLEDLVFLPGDFCFIDNYFLVHGRKAFQPLYDGNGRWLKRVNITTDLRKSRAFRSDENSRVITPNQY